MMISNTVHIGDQTVTGNLCPCSGWWMCVDEGRLLGGRRQRFERGQRVPPAIVLKRRSLLQWLRREQPMVELPTVWTLLAYEEIDTLPMPIEDFVRA